MTQTLFGKTFAGAAPSNYERYFVPVIPAPLARELVRTAALRPGERVLDVACGTGVVARLAAQAVSPGGTVAGVDVNAGMLAEARRASPVELDIRWYETSAESMPLPDSSFDVILCQLGLQFVPDKLAALREMRRLLAPGGRALVSVPGPTPPLFSAMADELARHVGAEAAALVHVVFSLHEEQELRHLMTGAGFREVDVQASISTHLLPPARVFLWQYAASSPLGEIIGTLSDQDRTALERALCGRWLDFTEGEHLRFDGRVTTVIGR